MLVSLRVFNLESGTLQSPGRLFSSPVKINSRLDLEPREVGVS